MAELGGKQRIEDWACKYSNYFDERSPGL